MTTTVFLTGATGYVGLHVCKQLLEANYGVVAFVRSEAKGEKLVAQFGSSSVKYEVVPDITVPHAYDEAVKKHPEATIFIHTASPMVVAAEDPARDIFNPGVDGTRNTLTAVHTYAPQVTHFVYTSSFVTMGRMETVYDPSKTLLETDWANYTAEECLSKDIEPKFAGLLAYWGGKVVAEKFAWDFVKENKTNFALTAICTSTVMGPQVFPVKGALNLSAELVNSLMSLKKDDAIPRPYVGGFVDVRDTARAHIVAFESEKARGQRLLMNSEMVSLQGALDIIHAKFPEVAKDMPVGTPGSMEQDVKVFCSILNSKTREILGFKFRSFEESVVDMAQQFIEVNK